MSDPKSGRAHFEPVLTSGALGFSLEGSQGLWWRWAGPGGPLPRLQEQKPILLGLGTVTVPLTPWPPSFCYQPQGKPPDPR